MTQRFVPPLSQSSVYAVPVHNQLYTSQPSLAYNSYNSSYFSQPQVHYQQVSWKPSFSPPSHFESHSRRPSRPTTFRVKSALPSREALASSTSPTSARSSTMSSRFTLKSSPRREAVTVVYYLSIHSSLNFLPPTSHRLLRYWAHDQLHSPDSLRPLRRLRPHPAIQGTCRVS